MLHNLTDLLQKFYALRPPERVVRDAVRAAVARYCDIELADGEITCRDGVAFLRVSPPARAEILLFKSQVLREVAETHHVSLRDIR